MAKGKKKSKKSKKSKKNKKGSVFNKLPLVFVSVSALIFMPTTVVLFIGMMPTLAASFVDKSKKGTMALTVGSMNLAGLTPFLLELWMQTLSMDNAMDIIMNAKTISIVYAAAFVGYLIDWALSGIVRTFLIQRSSRRLKEIKKRQERLVGRWGREVSGDVPLDEYGFPIGISHEDAAN